MGVCGCVEVFWKALGSKLDALRSSCKWLLPLPKLNHNAANGEM